LVNHFTVYGLTRQFIKKKNYNKSCNIHSNAQIEIKMIIVVLLGIAHLFVAILSIHVSNNWAEDNIITYRKGNFTVESTYNLLIQDKTIHRGVMLGTIFLLSFYLYIVNVAFNIIISF
jgi:hypothetical protein